MPGDSKTKEMTSKYCPADKGLSSGCQGDGESTVRASDRSNRGLNAKEDAERSKPVEDSTTSGREAGRRLRQTEEEKEGLAGERVHMVIDRLHGPQTSYRAAQRFLRNRTLNKMADNKGMTLYDRIMAYRKLKDGEEGDSPQTSQSANRNSPAKSSPTHQQQKYQQQQQQFPPASSTSSRSTVSSNSKDKPTAKTSRTLSADRNSSTKSSGRSSGARSGGEGNMMPRKLERSDSSFGSVDISELTGLQDGEKNRSPTPLPTFDDRPYSEGDGQNDLHKEDRGRERMRRDRRTSSALSDSPEGLTAVAMTTARSQSSAAESREVRRVSREEERSTRVSNRQDTFRRETAKKESTYTEFHNSRSHKNAWNNGHQGSIESTAVLGISVSSGISDPSSPASSSTRKRERVRSEWSKRIGREQQQSNATIAALDKLADKNLRRLLGDDIDDEGDPEIDQAVLDKVFSPQFQAELDNFLRTT